MNNKILILRTSISNKQDIGCVGRILDKCERIERWNVDFEDWEKVLRIECADIEVAEVADMLKDVNIYVAELEC